MEYGYLVHNLNFFCLRPSKAFAGSSKTQKIVNLFPKRGKRVEKKETYKIPDFCNEIMPLDPIKGKKSCLVNKLVPPSNPSINPGIILGTIELARDFWSEEK